jgi:hypothetical protein
MKKPQIVVNRAARRSPEVARGGASVLTGTALSQVKGRGGPDSPDLNPTPVGGGGDPGPSSSP